MYYKSGELIKLLRLQRGLSQEQLAEDIIERANLSKAERGKHALTKEKMDALLDRLGYVSTRLIPYALSDEEHKIFSLRDELDNCLACHNLDRAAELLAEMEELPAFQTELQKQYLLKSKATLYRNQQEGNPTHALKLLEEAIKITIPDFDEKHAGIYFLTSQDVEIINQIALIHHQEGKANRAIGLLEKTVASIRKNVFDEHEKTRSLALVLYNLSSFLGLQMRFDYALEICNEAIDACRDNRVYGILPHLTFNKACCLFYLGQIEKVRPLFLQTYYGCLMQGQNVEAEHTLSYAKENFQIDITEENP